MWIFLRQLGCLRSLRSTAKTRQCSGLEPEVRLLGRGPYFNASNPIDFGVLAFLKKALFERRRYKALTAASARQGMQIAAVCTVGAVIVDYHMPEINGDEVAMEIKRLKPHTPIVMISSDDRIPARGVEGGDAVLSKDEPPNRFLPLIARLCDERFTVSPKGRALQPEQG